MNVGIYYFRSLYSQSISSISVGKFSDFLLNRGYDVKLGVLKKDDFSYNREQLNRILANDFIIYKTNYKDFEYGIRFFEELKKNYPQKSIYITGPFANLNENSIREKYSFINEIFNMQDIETIERIFPKIGKDKIEKNTIVYGIDREIEYQENGKYINLEASTGCIYNCSFCHVNILNYQQNTIEIHRLVDEIEFLVNKMGKKYLIFNDSVFWKNENDTSRIIELVSEIKKRNIKFYFMIYLSINNKIPTDLLNLLKEIGLIRIFFGVENISNNFQISNNKYVSENDAKNFMKLLEERNITYHIGFILFSYETVYEDLLLNLKFLWEIGKLFRPGILVEKMRILPGTKNSKILYHTEEKIDQAYNYKIKDEKVEKCYNLICEYFKNINIRYFEHFFSSINIAIAILREERAEKKFKKEITNYYKTIDMVNKRIYDILRRMFTNFKYTEEDIKVLLDLYSKSEFMYMIFSEKLKENVPEVFMMLPHGKEDINV